MALEALSTNELLNFIIYDTISATPYSCEEYSPGTTTTTTTCFQEYVLKPPQLSGGGALDSSTSLTPPCHSVGPEADDRKQNLAVQGRKKRRRRPKVCKNKEEAETQRMTHITVERNRRKQMNEHLAVLRSLMPVSYVQRGDQASIVGGAIEFVKELEHLLQTLEAQKFLLFQQGEAVVPPNQAASTAGNSTTAKFIMPPPFSQFFAYPQYTWSQTLNKCTSKSKAAVADVEVTLIETHANIRVFSRRSLRQLSKIVAGFQTLHLTILHLSVTTLDPLVLYSISAKVEEGCQLISADDIAGAVHHMLRMIEEEVTLYEQS